MNDQLSDFRRAGERDLVNVGMGRQRCAGRFAVAGDDVHDAFGKSGFLDQLAQHQRGQRSLFGRL